MSDLGWCIVFFVLVLMFLGSELSLYENARLLLKCIEEQQKQKKKEQEPDKKPGE